MFIYTKTTLVGGGKDFGDNIQKIRAMIVSLKQSTKRKKQKPTLA